MKTALFSVASAVSLVLLAGCADSAEDDGIDSAESDITGSQANFGYFSARVDGDGYAVKRVNQAKTTCADGSKKAECHVSAITFGGAALSDAEDATALEALTSGHAVVKAKLYKNGNGTLKANEVWLGATSSAADGTFYRIADNGIRCITAPCPSTTAFNLNSNDSHQIVSYSIDATENPATQEQLDAATAAVGTKDGILVAGGLALPKCMAGATNCGPFVHASEFFLRFTHSEAPAAVVCGARAGDTCGENEYCQFTEQAICGWADATGVCAPKPTICPQYISSVCGCDGQTYGNSCFAAEAGTSVAAQGACAPVEPEPQHCGGIAGIQCADGQYCSFAPEAMCGAADQMGTCAVKPEACTQQYNPVCGCDDHTYGNACTAASAGVSVVSEGECAAPAGAAK